MEGDLLRGGGVRLYDLSTRAALNFTYAWMIRNADTPESRMKIDRMIGLIKDTPGTLPKDVMTKDAKTGKLMVSEAGVNALDAFMASHSAKPAAPTLEPMATDPEGK